MGHQALIISLVLLVVYAIASPLVLVLMYIALRGI